MIERTRNRVGQCAGILFVQNQSFVPFAQRQVALSGIRLRVVVVEVLWSDHAGAGIR